MVVETDSDPATTVEPFSAGSAAIGGDEGEIERERGFCEETLIW